jgi:hypothetical protein
MLDPCSEDAKPLRIRRVEFHPPIDLAQLPRRGRWFPNRQVEAAMLCEQGTGKRPALEPEQLAFQEGRRNSLAIHLDVWPRAGGL